MDDSQGTVFQIQDWCTYEVTETMRECTIPVWVQARWCPSTENGGPTFNQEAICSWYSMTQRKITGYTNHFRAGPTSSWPKQNSMYLFLWTFSFLLLLLVYLLLVLLCLFVLFSFYGLYLFWFWFWKRKSRRVKKHMVGLVGRWEWSVRNWGIGKNMVKIPYMNKCLIKNKINKFNTKNSQTSLCLYI